MFRNGKKNKKFDLKVNNSTICFICGLIILISLIPVLNSFIAISFIKEGLIKPEETMEKMIERNTIIDMSVWEKENYNIKNKLTRKK